MPCEPGRGLNPRRVGGSRQTASPAPAGTTEDMLWGWPSRGPLPLSGCCPLPWTHSQAGPSPWRHRGPSSPGSMGPELPLDVTCLLPSLGPCGRSGCVLTLMFGDGKVSSNSQGGGAEAKGLRVTVLGLNPGCACCPVCHAGKPLGLSGPQCPPLKWGPERPSLRIPVERKTLSSVTQHLKAPKR